MKKTYLTLTSACLIALYVACGGGDTRKPDGKEHIESISKDNADAGKECSYSYDHKSTNIYWTAYKHTKKVEVQGQFDSIEVVGAQTSNNPVDVIRNIQFRIFTKSINSKDINRDKKIRDQFFGTMSNTQEITCMVKSLDESTGEVILALKMNDIEKELPAEYSVEGEVIKLRCVLDLNEYSGKAAIDALNKVCEEKHTVLDGGSIFWPYVKILVQSTLKKDCEEEIQ